MYLVSKMITGKFKTLLTAAAFIFCSSAAFAQNDVIYLHNGQKVEGKIFKISENTVSFAYANEDAEQTLGKYAIEKVVYGKSGRIQNITDKIIVQSEGDWRNVIIIDNKDEIAGLKRVDEVKGKTAFINYRTGEGSDRKALEKLKKDAAAMHCQFIYITTDKDIDRKSDDGGSFGQLQSIKKGIAYSY